jgi:hypothetical protein
VASERWSGEFGGSAKMRDNSAKILPCARDMCIFLEVPIANLKLII